MTGSEASWAMMRPWLEAVAQGRETPFAAVLASDQIGLAACVAGLAETVLALQARVAALEAAVAVVGPAHVAGTPPVPEEPR